MENGAEKPWTRPWSTREIAENAHNWSLAADVGLLKHLEQFADNLLGKCEQTNSDLEAQLNQLQNISLSLDIAKSKFLSLQNTQFIENRVYEDDETEVLEANDGQKEKKEGDTERKEIMKSAVLKGLSILDKYYDKIEVPASDSEDDDTSTNFVLNPKDPYLSRQLPYIIGSEEWHKKWHVGLIESSSESEEDKVSEKYSDSDSELDLPVTNRGIKNHVSDTVSDDFSDKMFNTQSGITSSTARQSDSPISADNESNSVPYQPNAGTNIFAEELAQKLGNVLTGANTSYNEPEVNKRPIQKPAPRQIGNFFDDEPPPLNDNDFQHGGDAHGIFSGGTGLFDDEDDTDSLWNVQPAKVQKPKEQNTSNFDDEDPDDLFAKPKSPIQSKKIVGGQAIIPNLFSNKEDLKKLRRRQSSSNESSDNEAKIVKPETKKPEVPPEVKKQEEVAPPQTKKLVKEEPVKKISLFDDDDDDTDLFSDSNLFPSTTPKKFFSDNIFDDDLFQDVPPLPEASSSKLFDDPIQKEVKITEKQRTSKQSENVKIKEEKPIEKKPVLNLFDDDDENSLHDDLFGNVPSFLQTKTTVIKPMEETKEDSKIVTENENKDVNDFASVIQSTVQKVHNDFLGDDIFDEPPPLPSIPKNIPQPESDFDEWNTKSEDDLFFDNSSTTKRSIFDSEPPSLFGNKDNESIPKISSGDLFNDPEKFEDIFDEFQHEANKKKDVPIIPDVKDTKDEKSENKIEEKPKETSNLVKSKFLEEVNKQEPSKAEVKSPPGKLKHNLNINVNALLPGLGPPRKKEVIAKESDEIQEVAKVSKENIEQTIDSSNMEEKKENEIKNVAISSDVSTKIDSNYANEDKVEVLQSITKDRAKPFNRRPSTRKARQENLRKSGIDFDYDAQKQSSLKEEKEPVSKVSTVPPLHKEFKEKVDVVPLKDPIIAKGSLEDTLKVVREPAKITTEAPKVFSQASKPSIETEKTSSNSQKNLTNDTKVSKTVDDSTKKVQAEEKKPTMLKTVTFEDLFGDDPEPEIVSNIAQANDKSSSLFNDKEKKLDFAKPKISSEEKLIKKDSQKTENKTVAPKLQAKEGAKGLFDDEDSDDDLFPNISKAKTPTETKVKEATKVSIPKLPTKKDEKTEIKRKGLFDDDEDSDDFFSAKKLPVKPKTAVKASLFDDESSEDDIFGTPSSSTKKTEDKTVKEKPQKKTTKTSTVKKLDSAIVKDPLDAFKN